MSHENRVKALQELEPLAEWTWIGEEYSGLNWLDKNKKKPTEKQINDKVLSMQTEKETEKTTKENAKTSAITKLKDLGLTDDEIKAIKEVV